MIIFYCTFSINEFREAPFDIDSNKSSRSNGLNPTFYKKNLEPNGPKNFVTTSSCLENNVLPDKINQASIAT